MTTTANADMTTLTTMATARVERGGGRSGRSAIEQDEWLQPWDRPQAPQNALVLHRYDRHSYVNNADDADDADDAIATSTTAASTTTTTPLAAHDQTVEELAWSGRPRRALASASPWALVRANPSVHAVQQGLEHRLRQLPFSELDEWLRRAVPHMKERYGVTYRFPLEPPH
jgi:hypothetical protein